MRSDAQRSDAYELARHRAPFAAFSARKREWRDPSVLALAE